MVFCAFCALWCKGQDNKVAKLSLSRLNNFSVICLSILSTFVLEAHLYLCIFDFPPTFCLKVIQHFGCLVSNICSDMVQHFAVMNQHINQSRIQGLCLANQPNVGPRQNKYWTQGRQNVGSLSDIKLAETFRRVYQMSLTIESHICLLTNTYSIICQI